MSTQNQLEKIRHSTAHLAAQAVLELYPDTLLTIGPATKEGFFYDFLPRINLKEEDLSKISEKMREIVARNLPITHEQISKQDAKKIFKDNPFKLELIDIIEGDTVGLSRQGTFYDLCKGGHVENTGALKYFLLTGLSGAYWRGDKKNTSLQRLSGTAFTSQQELEEYVKRKEELSRYDHRKLGKQLNLFSFHKEGTGFPFFHAHGKVVLNQMTQYLRELQNIQGYQEITTPIMLSQDLWKQSGHYEFYKDNMYFSHIDNHVYAIRPMNCPGAFLLYNERPRSYKELPLKLSEFGLVHRHELSGVLHGLLRVRSFTIDDAHIFCMPDQLEQEIDNTIKLIYQVLKSFGFTDIHVALSTRPENAMGSLELWHQAEQSLQAALEKNNITFEIQKGEGAFYGPKIEFKITDSMDREWQCSTIQIDFFQAENFNMSYISSSDQRERPVIIHRAIYGSLERFFAIILEHFKGKFPFWLAPEQIRILPITDHQLAYAQEIHKQLEQVNFRVKVDQSTDPISAKIKAAQLDYIPWMIIVGKREQAENQITLRHQDGSQEQKININELISRGKTHIEQKS